ncbi:MAG: ATP-binding protein [Dysgonamonadaceae bacterium]|jgi:predicted AAA+ superfamily ATPase|nr:ATP-binding protein [Dysgonamonadaceae bacterium]
MYRKGIKQLLQWKLSADRKPLLILGARQVGKTWLLKEFGNTEYRQMVYINFEEEKQMQALFVPDFSISRIISALEAYAGHKIEPAETLIVFDEIQAASGGITSLKYFCENAPEYQVVVSDSLLGMALHEGVSFPVGKVDFMHLYPMSFYEFLLAMGETGLAGILENRQWDILSLFSNKFIEFLRYYFYVGGMPEAVAAFAENRDWQKVRKVQNRILLTYERDFSKHAPKELLPRIKMAWKSIPSQLAKENRKFIYGLIKEGARAKEYELAIQWLLDSGLLIQCFCTKEPRIPLNAYQDLSAFKLYHNDIGLLGAMSKLSPRTVVEGDRLFTEYKGVLAEQFVIQQLRLNEDFAIYYFVPDTYSMEVDFIVQNENDEIIPIEVKAETNLKAKSFRMFCQKYSPQNAIRTSLSDYQKESWMTNVPLYIIGDYQI